MQASVVSALLAIGLAAAACGRAPDSSGLSSLVPKKPVFVVSGGFFSCQAPWSKPVNTATFTGFKPTLDAVGGDAPAFVATCFNLSHNTIWYQTDQQATVGSTTPDKYYDLVADRLAAAGEGAELVMVGHSWGAWLTLSNAPRLAALAKVAYLATVDAISWRQCPPAVVAGAIWGNADADVADEACVRAPADLAGDYHAVASATARWDNFYQDSFRFLHSSAIADAVTSTHLDYHLSLAQEWEAHMMIDKDLRVWEAVKGALR